MKIIMMDHIFSKFHNWCPNSFVNNYLYTLMCHIGVYKNTSTKCNC